MITFAISTSCPYLRLISPSAIMLMHGMRYLHVGSTSKNPTEIDQHPLCIGDWDIDTEIEEAKSRGPLKNKRARPLNFSELTRVVRKEKIKSEFDLVSRAWENFEKGDQVPIHMN